MKKLIMCLLLLVSLAVISVVAKTSYDKYRIEFAECISEGHSAFRCRMMLKGCGQWMEPY